jgi:molecular chaperone GrpE
MADENKNLQAVSAGEASAAAGNLEDEVEKLRQQLTVKEEEAKANQERWLRQAAELENFKKRTGREREDAIRFANESLAKDLLPVIDNLERAVAHAGRDAECKSLLEGVEMIHKSLLDVLSKHGLSRIAPAVGQTFDPALHEAMAQVELENHEPNTVVSEHHGGYLFRSRLLRPALVTVAKGAKSQDKKTANGSVENGHSGD